MIRPLANAIRRRTALPGVLLAWGMLLAMTCMQLAHRVYAPELPASPAFSAAADTDASVPEGDRLTQHEEPASDQHGHLDLEEGGYRRRHGFLSHAALVRNPGRLRHAPGLPAADPRLRLNHGHAPPHA